MLLIPFGSIVVVDVCSHNNPRIFVYGYSMIYTGAVLRGGGGGGFGGSSPLPPKKIDDIGAC